MEKNNKTILCFGSVHEGDKLAFDLHDMLKGNIVCKKIAKSENPFELASYLETDHLVILDVVKGIEKVTLFNNVKDFKKTQTVTIHDLDLGFVLKLLEEADGKKFKIVGVPYGAKKEDIIEEVKRIISSV
ncbi:MAG: hypothetical protein KAS04_01605 [Candidatus Aenigmarchaeota archaeon]|nr:hypothetical protein [Candidatus Aenigmarchaeota archaeon]